MAAAAPTGTGSFGVAPALGRLSDFADRAATPVSHRVGGREIAALAVRRGAELRAYLDLCPPVFLPLTWRGRRVLSGDGSAYAASTTAPSSPSRTVAACPARAARAA